MALCSLYANTELSTLYYPLELPLPNKDFFPPSLFYPFFSLQKSPTSKEKRLTVFLPDHIPDCSLPSRQKETTSSSFFPRDPKRDYFFLRSKTPRTSSSRKHSSLPANFFQKTQEAQTFFQRINRKLFNASLGPQHPEQCAGPQASPAADADAASTSGAPFELLRRRRNEHSSRSTTVLRPANLRPSAAPVIKVPMLILGNKFYSAAALLSKINNNKFYSAAALENYTSVELNRNRKIL